MERSGGPAGRADCVGRLDMLACGNLTCLGKVCGGWDSPVWQMAGQGLPAHWAACLYVLLAFAAHSLATWPAQGKMQSRRERLRTAAKGWHLQLSTRDQRCDMWTCLRCLKVGVHVACCSLHSCSGSSIISCMQCNRQHGSGRGQPSHVSKLPSPSFLSQAHCCLPTTKAEFCHT